METALSGIQWIVPNELKVVRKIEVEFIPVVVSASVS